MRLLRDVLGSCLAVALVAAGRAAADQPTAPTTKPAADAHGDPLPAGALARLGTTRWRHAADVTFVAFGPGGKTLLTAGQDNTLRLWDLATGKEIRRFARPKPIAPKPPIKGAKVAAEPVEINAVIELMGGGGGGGGFTVAVSPDGKTLAAASGNAIQLWEVETGKELRLIQGPANGVGSLLFSPDGRTLAARARGNTFYLWATDTGKELHRINPPAPRRTGNDVVFFLGGGQPDVPGMAFSPDGKALAAAVTTRTQEAETRSIKFWDVTTGKETRQIKAPEGTNLSAVAFAPLTLPSPPGGEGRVRGGKLLAYGGNDVVHLCEADTGKEVRQLKTPGGLAALVFSPDGKTLAVRGRNQRVRLFETETGKALHQVGDAAAPAQPGGDLLILGDFADPETRALAFSPDGKQLAAAAGSTVRLWDTATGKELHRLDGHWQAPSAIALSADGKTVISWGGDRVIRRWEAATGASLGAFQAPPRTTLAALSRDGKIVALANADNTIRLHDTATGKELHRLPGHPNGAAGLTFSADGKTLASRGSGDNTIRIHDVAKGGEPRQIALAPGNNQGGGRFIILGGGRRNSRPSGPGLAFSPDGKLLVAPGPSARAPGGDNPRGTLVVIDVAAGKELRKIESSRGITSFAFAPDGRTVATENGDRTVTLWEVASGKERARLGQPAAAEERATGGMRGFVVMVDGVDFGSSDAAAGPVGVAYSPDGRALAYRGPDQSVRVWDVLAGKEVGQFKGHSGRLETVAFTPNGKALASGGSDTTILLWDAAGVLKDLSRPQPGELSAAAVEALWGDLAGADAGKALQSTLKLATAPRQSVSFLAEQLKPAATIDPQKIDRWIADLESGLLTVRRGAVANLLKTGEQAVPALRKVLEGKPVLETRKRVEELLDRLTGGTLTAEELRLVRAVEALERMSTPEARKLLRTLAQGAPGALPTREAQAALARMKEAMP